MFLVQTNEELLNQVEELQQSSQKEEWLWENLMMLNAKASRYVKTEPSESDTGCVHDLCPVCLCLVICKGTKPQKHAVVISPADHKKAPVTQLVLRGAM